MHVCLIGYGNMGGAMLDGWLNRRAPDDRFSVIDPAINGQVAGRLAEQGARCFASASQFQPEDEADVPDVVVLAVKPQIMAEVMADCQHIGTGRTVFVSIAAGISLDGLRQMIPQSSAIIRAMPNSPVKVGAAITAITSLPDVSDQMIEMTRHLLSAIGEVVVLEDEGLMDAVTALSGSGPAYVFYLTETMAEAGRALGLDEDMAMQLARQTIIGAGALMQHDDNPADKLRENVTSEGGTTAAALSVLMADDGLAGLMAKAMRAARDRGVELNSASDAGR
jgi:pyrroline-5-carboxylate reductase